jgi:hypothetical protein
MKKILIKIEWKLYYALRILLDKSKFCWHKWVHQVAYEQDYGRKKYECSKCGWWK